MSLTVEKCLQAWTNSLRQMNAKADIVFFGDSLTYYGDFSSVFPDKVVCNLGLRGDTIQGMIDRVEQVKMLEPKVVYLMAGINDVAKCTSHQFEYNFECLINGLMNQIPGADIRIQSLLPVNDILFSISCSNSQICDINNIIKSIAFCHNFRFIDLFSAYESGGVLPKDLTLDGVHLTVESYQLWIDTLKGIN